MCVMRYDARLHTYANVSLANQTWKKKYLINFYSIGIQSDNFRNEWASDRASEYVNTSTQNAYTAVVDVVVFFFAATMKVSESLVSNYEIELIQQRRAFIEMYETRAAHMMI